MDFKEIINKIDADGDGFELSDLKNVTKLNADDFKDALGEDFLAKFTNFGSVKDLLAKAGVEKPEDLAKLNPDKLNALIKENSSFGSVGEMLAAAKKKIS